MRRVRAWPIFAAVLAAALGLAALRLERRAPLPPLAASLAVAEAMAGDPAGFLRAERPRPFAFPADHGPHDGYRTEWWYFTGTLFGEGGRAFGYQLTFFRNALAPGPHPAGASALRARTVWMAHLALSDERGGRFRWAERLAREAIGLAGARAEPFRVWVEGWEASAPDGTLAPLALRARAEGLAIDLTLAPERPVVLQGEAGLSAKGPEAGNASYYYSIPRLATRGEVTLDGERFAVEGRSWLDREWSTSALAPELEGWDWLALQLDDGRDLMLYRLRRRDGSADPFSAAAVIEPAGDVRRLAAGDFALRPLGRWTSPRGGDYPAAFRVEVPSLGLELEARPRLADQELTGLVRYWEGAVRVTGRSPEGPIGGQGFLEMTGYADAPPGASRRPAQNR